MPWVRLWFGWSKDEWNAPFEAYFMSNKGVMTAQKKRLRELDDEFHVVGLEP